MMVAMKKIEPWQNKFYSQILERGNNYFKQGLVRNIKEKNGTLTALVGSGYFYDVRIQLQEDGKIKYMHCDCPYAENGRHCKHEAALLYAYESGLADEPKDDRKKKEERIYPFKEDFEKRDLFYDLHKLTKDYVILKDRYEEALRMIEDNEADLEDIGSGFTNRSDEQVLYAEASFPGKSRKSYARAYLNENEIFSMNCYDPLCQEEREKSFWNRYYRPANSDKKLCVHEIVLLIYMRDYILKYDPGDLTNRDSMHFLDYFSDNGNLSKAKAEESTLNDVQLVPKLEYERDGILKAGFRIGTVGDKTFVVKDLEDLVDAYKNKQVFMITSRRWIHFDGHDFDEESKPYYEFIEKAVSDEKTRDEIRSLDRYENSESAYFSIRKDILLYGARLDEFFALCKGNLIEMNDKSGKTNEKYDITLDEAMPKTYLSVSGYFREDGFSGVRLSGKLPELISGSSYGYCLKDKILYQVDPSHMEMIHSLKQSISTTDVDLTIGKKQLGRFYHHVLPKLREEFEVFENNRDLYERYIPPKPSYDFYFDVADGMILCKAKVSYGEKEFDILNGAHDNSRDYGSERMIGKLIGKVFYDRDEKNEFFVMGGDDVIFEIMEDLIPQLMKYGDVHSTASFDRLKVKRRTNLSVGVKVDNGLLELDIKSEDISLEELAAIVNSYRQKKKYHKLKSGDLVRTDDENLETLDALLSSLNISLKDFVAGKMHVPSYRALYLDKVLESNEAIYDHRDAHFRKLVKDFKTIKESDFEVPSSMKEVMRSYQKNGYQWLRTLSHFGFGGILADEMGLGKTIQILALLLNNKENEGKTSLVVCPSSLIYNWLSEIRRFTPDLKAAAIAGTQSDRNKIIKEYQDYDVLVTSYDLLRRDIAEYEDVNFDYEILDEAQYIKTYTTANAKACKVIKAKGRFALTGTPIENNLSELWSIFDYLMPGFLFSYEVFKQRYEAPIAKENDERAMERLKNMIAPFILRRKKADVLADLPDKLEEIIKVRFDDKQRKLYDSQVLKISKFVDDASFEQNKIAVLAELMKLRQICCEPKLVYEDFGEESAKRQACIELISNAIAEGHKILLFSQFTSMLEILEKELDKQKIPYYKIIGQTKKEERLKLVEDFNEKDVPLFLISLKAGGTGLNLTGADIVIHYDPWWNIAAQNQATDRAHRIGQKNVVTVYKIIAEDSIEEKIIDMQQRKAKLADSVLDGQSVSLAAMSKEELLQLLK